MAAIADDRWSVSQVLGMVDAGLLPEDDHVELIDGRMIAVTPQGAPHTWSVTQIAARIRRRLAARDDLLVVEEKPLVVDDLSLPEPDVALVRADAFAGGTRLPTGQDAVLVVEIAVTSQRLDALKADLYARAGIPVYWLVDVPARTVTVHTEPTPDGYGQRTVIGETGALTFDGAEGEIPVASFLPRADAAAE